MENNVFANKVVECFKVFLQDKNIPETAVSSEGWANLYNVVCAAVPKFKGENDIDRINLLIGSFEDVLVTHNIDIPNDERDDDEDAALIYGEDYYNLEDEVLAICKDFVKASS